MEYANSAMQAQNLAPPTSIAPKDATLCAEMLERQSHSLGLTERVFRTLTDLRAKLYGEVAVGNGPKADKPFYGDGFAGQWREGQATLTDNLINIETLALELASRT